jgi:amidohydrolase
MEARKRAAADRVDQLTEDLFELSRRLYENPETAFQEHQACRWLSRWLEERGFSVQTGAGGIETAFLAQPPGFSSRRPRLAFMAEYDALPKLGHGCGHNLIAASSLGAAAALVEAAPDLDGDFVVIGTPAEEGGGGKARLAEAGVFDSIDAAMLLHPGRHNKTGDPSLGRIKLTVEFFGQTAHAAAAPHLGRNALDAMILAYTNVSAMRQQLPPDVRVHGVITHGGDAPNIVPDYTSALYYLRSARKTYLIEKLLPKFENCLKGAAEAAGCQYQMTVKHPILEPMRRNHALENAWAANAEALGVEIDRRYAPPGSTDVGNISHLMPTIQPRLAICDETVAIHSVAFADATQSERGRRALILAAKSLALTAYDYLTRTELRQAASEEFTQDSA